MDAMNSSHKVRSTTRLVFVAMALVVRDDEEPPIYKRGVDYLAGVCFPTMNEANARRAVFKAMAELEAAALIQSFQHQRFTNRILTFGGHYVGDN